MNIYFILGMFCRVSPRRSYALWVKFWIDSNKLGSTSAEMFSYLMKKTYFENVWTMVII